MSRSLTSKNIRNFVPVLKPKMSNDFPSLPSPLTLKLATPSDESAFTLDSSFEEDDAVIDSHNSHRSTTFKLKPSKTILALLIQKH